MPAFYILAFIGLVFLWFACSGFYRNIGKIFGAIYDDAKDEITSFDDEEEEN